MFRTSIRWRLAVSFAGIALLATLSLGIVQLFIVRNYYAGQERAYLEDTANAITFTFAQTLDRDATPQVLYGRLESFGFISQSRIQVLDLDGVLIADSGSPGTRLDVSLVLLPTAVTQEEQHSAEPGGSGEPDTVSTLPRQTQTVTERMGEGSSGAGSEYRVITQTGATSTDFSLSLDGRSPEVMVVPAVSPFYGSDQSGRGGLGEPRSKIEVQQPIHNANGLLLGYLVISEGPAYGTRVVQSVARGWGIASVVAVTLAVAVGWWASQSISLPLLRLTEVTSRMTAGDLTARARESGRQDELGTLARTFNRMADRMERTVNTLRAFVSDAAHEIHTPLTTLRANLDLLPADDAVERAQTQVERLEALTDSLLDLSRIEADAQSTTRAQVDLRVLLQQAAERYASRAEQADLGFRLELPEQPVVVDADATQLRRAVDNLLDNACKFTPPGGDIGLALKESNGEAIIVTEDTGIGIPPGDLPYLFQRFHRGRNASHYPGSGLGLALVRAVAVSHRGTVVAENTARGSRFTLSLPTRTTTA